MGRLLREAWRLDLIERYRQMAAKGTQLWGLSILQHAREIQGLIEKTGSTRLLDFGCGGAAAYREPNMIHLQWKIEMPALYDPAFPQFELLPDGTFDGVLCSDVLEHIAIEDVPETIGKLFERADKFVWASVCCRQAKKTFEDGLNLHVTVRPYAWWRREFETVSRAVSISRFGEENRVIWKLTETP